MHHLDIVSINYNLVLSHPDSLSLDMQGGFVDLIEKFSNLEGSFINKEKWQADWGGLDFSCNPIGFELDGF